jgi:hypothetical protein
MKPVVYNNTSIQKSMEANSKLITRGREAIIRAKIHSVGDNKILTKIGSDMGSDKHE